MKTCYSVICFLTSIPLSCWVKFKKLTLTKLSLQYVNSTYLFAWYDLTNVIQWNVRFFRVNMIITVECDPQFYGSDCSHRCLFHVNSSHGRCNMSGKMVCEDHYFGPKCNIFCTDKTNGTCNDYGKLICNTHFFGNECSRYCVDTDHGNCSTAGFLHCQNGKLNRNTYLYMSIHFRDVNLIFENQSTPKPPISHETRYCIKYNAYILYLIDHYEIICT